jgi:hypothetical protein
VFHGIALEAALRALTTVLSAALHSTLPARTGKPSAADAEDDDDDDDDNDDAAAPDSYAGGDGMDVDEAPATRGGASHGDLPLSLLVHVVRRGLGLADHPDLADRLFDLVGSVLAEARKPLVGAGRCVAQGPAPVGSSANGRAWYLRGGTLSFSLF